MIYNRNGSHAFSAYGVDGTELDFAYDVSKTEVYRRAPITFKVMTYNVGGWYIGSGENVPADKDAEYYALQTGMFESNDVDTLGLQEHMTQFSRLPRTAESVLEPYFPYRNCRQVGTYYGRGICAKYPITGYTVLTYADNANRYYDRAYITVEGKRIAVFTTHLDVHSLENRQAEIAELIPVLKAEPYFICFGDFNTGITASTANMESTQYINMVKPFIDEGFHSANFADFGFMVTCVDSSGVEWYLDNIYTSSNIEITDAHVDTTKLTDSIEDTIDHMPLIATLSIPVE